MNDPGLDETISDASAAVKEQIKDEPSSAHPNAQTAEHPGQNPYFNQDSPEKLEESYDQMDEEEQEKNFLLPARWWHASTGIPLVAGTFGPMANAFSICALVEKWRVRIPKGGTEEHGIDIKDPNW